MTPRPSGSVGSVVNAFTILEALYASNGAGITELAEDLDLSKSTIHSHLQTLNDLGYVEKRGTDYDIGLRFLTFGGYVRDRTDLFEIAKEGADEIAEETGELAAISTESRGENLYLYQVRGAKAMSLDSHLGARLPLHCTATGKAILASMPEDRVDEIVDRAGLPPATENTIPDFDALRNELSTTAGRGVSFDDEERIDGMRGIACPIVHQEHEVVLGAIGVTGPTNRMTGTRYEEDIPELVSRIARMIEINATYA